MSASDARARLVALTALALCACGSLDDDPTPLAPTEATREWVEPPSWWSEDGAIDSIELLAWTRARGYATWRSSGWPRPTAEGGSRVFVDATLQDALARGDTTHPVGVVAVRELFEDDLFTPRATNVLVKVAPGHGAESWRWFELPATAPDAWTVDARAAEVCVGCHAAAADAVMTAVPLGGALR